MKITSFEAKWLAALAGLAAVLSTAVFVLEKRDEVRLTVVSAPETSGVKQ